MTDDPNNTERTVPYNPETNTYHATFDGTKIDPSIAIIETIASISETRPTNLDPLYEVIDPTELDSIVLHQGTTRQRGDCSIEFTYMDYTVSVKSYGRIVVRPRSASRTESN